MPSTGGVALTGADTEPTALPVTTISRAAPSAIGGGGAIIDASSWDAREGFKVTAAASMRMVVSLDNFDDSRWINMTGVSGHAFHPHYVDQTDLWARGETLGWAFSAEAVDAAAEDRLTLEPAP